MIIRALTLGMREREREGGGDSLMDDFHKNTSQLGLKHWQRVKVHLLMMEKRMCGVYFQLNSLLTMM